MTLFVAYVLMIGLLILFICRFGRLNALQQKLQAVQAVGVPISIKIEEDQVRKRYFLFNFTWTGPLVIWDTKFDGGIELRLS